MILLAFPCDIYIASKFCQRINTIDAIVIILEKQEKLLKELLMSTGVKRIFILNEDFYGRVTSTETQKTLAEIKNFQIEESYFPMNDFCGNVALLLAILARHVTAVNATSDIPVELNLRPMNHDDAEEMAAEKFPLDQLQQEIVRRLKEIAPRLDGLYPGEGAGERPTTGLALNSPYECEVLFRYMDAGKKIRGHVLEIGCGIGYGAFSMARLHPNSKIIAMDYDSKAIEVARLLWKDNERLDFKVGDARRLPFEDEYFDCVVCFEVIEHVDQPELLLSEIHRVLKKNGKLIGSTPNYKLYPYKANKYRGIIGTTEELRSLGIWPWHIQEFDENSLNNLLTDFGFSEISFQYPTFTKGIKVLEKIKGVPFNTALNYLSELSWSVLDFSILDRYYPCFSGFSFVFSATSRVL